MYVYARVASDANNNRVQTTDYTAPYYSSSHLQWHFRKLFQSSKLKAQSSNVSFQWNMAKQTFELWALSFERAFENVTPDGMGCTSAIICMCMCMCMCMCVCMCVSHVMPTTMSTTTENVCNVMYVYVYVARNANNNQYHNKWLYLYCRSLICCCWLLACTVSHGTYQTNEWVTSHIWMSHVTRMNRWCHTCEWVMSHIWMSHITYLNSWCRTYGWVISHTGMRHVTYLNESCHTYG